MLSDTNTQTLTFIDTLYHTNESCKSVWGVAQKTASTIQAPRELSVTQDDVFTGIIQLRSNGTLRVRLAQTTRFIPRRRYEEALSLLNSFSKARPKRSRPMMLAWIAKENFPLLPFPAALASRGIDLSRFLFLESRYPQRTLQSLCVQNLVNAILYDAAATPGALQIARRWVKPATQPNLLQADALADQRCDKLVIFMDR